MSTHTQSTQQAMELNGLTNTAVPNGEARTQAMELNVQRRFARGFNLNASYMRMLQENKTFIDNEFDRGAVTWWTSDTARPHRVTFTAIYEFPFGKGRRFVTSGILNHLFGGWQTAATYEFQCVPLQFRADAINLRTGRR